MARYIENLNSCTDPGSGDYMWVVDASAGSTDKDRKVDMGLFPQLAATNTFTANQTINKAAPTFTLQGSGQSLIALAAVDNGADLGPLVSVDRNSNASTPAAGHIRMRDKGGQFYSVWPDDFGVLRIHTSGPTSANDTSGTVVGTQTSSLDSKHLFAGMTSIEDVLAAVQQGAEAVRRFTYKNGAYNGEEFEGVVVDYAPRYGMDCDDEHEAGKSLNLINAVGDLLRAVAWLVEKEKARAEIDAQIGALG